MRHLRIYRAIQLVTKEGSIRKAAENMAISPSALNRSIQAFEAELGVDLFERIPGGVRLSVAGELIIRPISEHLAQMDDYLNTIAELKGGSVGTLSVSVASDLWPTPVGTVVDAFRRQFPSVAVNLLLDDTLATLRGRDADLAIVSVPTSDDETELLLSARAPIHCCGSPKMGPNSGPTLADLMNLRLVLPAPGTGVRQAVDLTLRKHGIKPGAVTTIPNAPDALQTASETDLLFSLAPPPEGSPFCELESTSLRLPPVQIAVFGRTSSPLSRMAERFTVLLGLAFDQLETPER